MAKIVAVGDVHGRDFWKKVLEQEKGEFDKFVFIGDYFDNFPPFPQRKIIENFKEILEFKRANPDRVVLLMGNHDYHYMSFARGQFSGYNKKFAPEISELLNDAFIVRGELQACYRHQNLLFTHAGVSKVWAKHAEVDISPEKIESSINRLLRHRPEWFNFIIGGSCNGSGDDPHQSPMWIRPDSLREHALDNFIQIVGHTTFKFLCTAECPDSKDAQIVLIDVPNAHEYIVFENGVTTIAKLNNHGEEKA